MSEPVRVARKRLDVGVPDLARGLLYCLTPPARAVAEQRVAAAWTPPESVLSCLSARSGLDLLLTAVDWPPGSEVLLSALTIPHVATLVRTHGFRPVPVDVDPETLWLDADAVERACTPATRALVHAQLLGASDDVGHLAAVARARGLLLVALDPDCRETHAAIAGVVYLPAYAAMSDSDLRRLAAVVNAAERHARVTPRCRSGSDRAQQHRR